MGSPRLDPAPLMGASRLSASAEDEDSYQREKRSGSEQAGRPVRSHGTQPSGCGESCECDDEPHPLPAAKPGELLLVQRVFQGLAVLGLVLGHAHDSLGPIRDDLAIPLEILRRGQRAGVLSDFPGDCCDRRLRLLLGPLLGLSTTSFSLAAIAHDRPSRWRRRCPPRPVATRLGDGPPSSPVARGG